MDVFVSHSQFQMEFSTHLFRALKKAFYSPLMNEVDDDISSWTQRKEWNDFMRNVDQRHRVVILVLSNEFFMSKRLMMELTEFAKAQNLYKFVTGSRGSGLNLYPKSNFLPVFLDMSFTEFDKNIMEKKWLKSWEDMKATDRSIDLNEWQQALSIIYDNMTLSYENEGYQYFIETVLSAVHSVGEPMKLWIPPFSLFRQRDDQVQNTSSKAPSREVSVGEQKFVEEPQGTRGGAVSNTTSPLIRLLQPANIEANLQTFDKLAIRHLDTGEASDIEANLQTFDKLVIRHRDTGEASGVGKVGMMEKLSKYFEIIEVCDEGVQKMESLKFNKAQWGYLAIKLQITVQIGRSFLYTRQSQPNEMYSILDIERWVEIFKLLLVLSKQVEGFFQDCSKNAWMQAAMTLANVGEYVSTLGFNLELCKIGLHNGGSVSTNYTLEEVGELNDVEVWSIEPSVVDDEEFLLNKAIEVSHSTNFEDAKLAKCLLLKLQGDVGDPHIDDDNSNFLKTVFGGFEWVKNIGGIVHQIGKGASAKVYKVMWFDTLVAKKTFLGFNNPEFRQEAKVLSQLHHPNITSMFCCNMTKKGCSIIMELMDGSLYDLLQKKTANSGDFHRFSNLEEIDLMLQVGDGVNYLHRQRIVHRDLKSDNILVKVVEIPNVGVEYVQAKVMDFGLSKTKETSISYSNMTYNVGTSRWMAPEIIKLRDDINMDCEGLGRLLKYNFKGDVYSFGMVCYEILIGEVPFQNEGSQRGVKMMVLKGLRPTLPEDCSPRLAKLIKKCWSEEPQLRPSMNEVCLELKYMKYLLLRGEVF